MELRENLEELLKKLNVSFRRDTVITQPVAVGELTLLPIVEITMGLYGGSGLAVSILPHTVLVIRGEEVFVAALQGERSLQKVREMTPQIGDRLRIIEKDGF